MGSYKLGGRQIQIQGEPLHASTAANVRLGAYQYLPFVTSYQAIDFAAEQIKQASLLFPVSIASAASTAAGGSLIFAASQFNSALSSLNSATFYNQAAGSQAAGALDVSTLMNWTLSPGDVVILFANSNTVGVPLNSCGVVLSATIDTVTSA